jgi:hypothetical protein
MAWGYGPSVIHDEERHCEVWRTWFLDECEQSRLFGLTAGHLKLVSLSGDRVEPYHHGTRIYLEDAPWFPHSGRRKHRLCGPYVVEATVELPPDSEPVHTYRGRVIVYHDRHAERGPWHNRSAIRRTIDGESVSFRQMAGQFDYFPYRFRIVPAPNCCSEYVDHVLKCWLCR